MKHTDTTAQVTSATWALRASGLAHVFFDSELSLIVPTSIAVPSIGTVQLSPFDALDVVVFTLPGKDAVKVTATTSPGATPARWLRSKAQRRRCACQALPMRWPTPSCRHPQRQT